MPMKNPPHPGAFVLDEVFEPLGLSISRAATLLGVRRARLSDIVNGKAALTADVALRIEKAFNIDMDTLLRMQAGYDAAQARRHAGDIHVARYEPSPA